MKVFIVFLYCCCCSIFWDFDWFHENCSPLQLYSLFDIVKDYITSISIYKNIYKRNNFTKFLFIRLFLKKTLALIIFYQYILIYYTINAINLFLSYDNSESLRDSSKREIITYKSYYKGSLGKLYKLFFLRQNIM